MKDPKNRKACPVHAGVLGYFPEAILYVALVSYIGNEQHNPGTPLHWDRSKSGDELDALARHLIGAGEFDEDGLLETGKIAWRALAALQKEIEGITYDEESGLDFLVSHALDLFDRRMSDAADSFDGIACLRGDNSGRAD